MSAFTCVILICVNVPPSGDVISSFELVKDSARENKTSGFIPANGRDACISPVFPPFGKVDHHYISSITYSNLDQRTVRGGPLNLQARVQVVSRPKMISAP